MEKVPPRCDGENEAGEGIAALPGRAIARYATTTIRSTFYLWIDGYRVECDGDHGVVLNRSTDDSRRRRSLVTIILYSFFSNERRSKVVLVRSSIRSTASKSGLGVPVSAQKRPRFGCGREEEIDFRFFLLPPPLSRAWACQGLWTSILDCSFFLFTTAH